MAGSARLSLRRAVGGTRGERPAGQRSVQRAYGTPFHASTARGPFVRLGFRSRELAPAGAPAAPVLDLDEIEDVVLYIEPAVG